jgi:hypothetical protein
MVPLKFNGYTMLRNFNWMNNVTILRRSYYDRENNGNYKTTMLSFNVLQSSYGVVLYCTIINIVK